MLITLPALGTQPAQPTPGQTPADSGLTPTIAFTPAPLSQGATTTPDAQIAVAAATELVATTYGTPAEQIELINVVPREWSDASLGCPQPDQAYPQVVTPGFLVTLQFGQQVFQVHTNQSGSAVICTEDASGEGMINDPVVTEFIAVARNNLSQELNVPLDSIVLIRSEAVEWRDGSLGCAKPGENYVLAETSGYRIVLAYGEARYEYHTDQQEMFLCAEPTE
jgi:hypothetical protein